MKRFVIDASQFESLDGFFKHADKVLCVGFTSGQNLDAFRDILEGGFGAFEPDEKIELIWHGTAKSKKDLGYSETVSALRKRLKRCHPTNRLTVESYLKEAKEKIGPTAYDWLVESIREKRHIVFREE